MIEKASDFLLNKPHDAFNALVRSGPTILATGATIAITGLTNNPMSNSWSAAIAPVGLLLVGGIVSCEFCLFKAEKYLREAAEAEKKPFVGLFDFRMHNRDAICTALASMAVGVVVASGITGGISVVNTIIGSLACIKVTDIFFNDALRGLNNLRLKKGLPRIIPPPKEKNSENLQVLRVNC